MSAYMAATVPLYRLAQVIGHDLLGYHADSIRTFACRSGSILCVSFCPRWGKTTHSKDKAPGCRRRKRYERKFYLYSWDTTRSPRRRMINDGRCQPRGRHRCRCGTRARDDISMDRVVGGETDSACH